MYYPRYSLPGAGNTQNHRCLSPPSPPSNAAEAHALYKCWESRLPNLRRPRALRLLQAVVANDAFASPPPTRFSKAIETHLFSAWETNDGVGGESRQTDEKGAELGDEEVGGDKEGERRRVVSSREPLPPSIMKLPLPFSSSASSSTSTFRRSRRLGEAMNLKDILGLLLAEARTRRIDIDTRRTEGNKIANDDEPTAATIDTAAGDGGRTAATGSPHARKQSVAESGAIVDSREQQTDGSRTTVTSHPSDGSGREPLHNPGTKPPVGTSTVLPPAITGGGIDIDISTPADSLPKNDGAHGTNRGAGSSASDEVVEMGAAGRVSSGAGLRSSTVDVQAETTTGGAEDGRRRELGLPADKETFASVYLGLYRHLSEAKGVPNGFKYRSTKQPADEGKPFLFSVVEFVWF